MYNLIQSDGLLYKLKRLWIKSSGRRFPDQIFRNPLLGYIIYIITYINSVNYYFKFIYVTGKVLCTIPEHFE